MIQLDDMYKAANLFVDYGNTSASEFYTTLLLLCAEDEVWQQVEGITEDSMILELMKRWAIPLNNIYLQTLDMDEDDIPVFIHDETTQWALQHKPAIYNELSALTRLAVICGDVVAEAIYDNHAMLPMLVRYADNFAESVIEFIIDGVNMYSDLVTNFSASKWIKSNLDYPCVLIEFTDKDCYYVRFDINNDNGTTIIMNIEDDAGGIVQNYHLAVSDFRLAIPEIMIEILRDKVQKKGAYTRYA